MYIYIVHVHVRTRHIRMHYFNKYGYIALFVFLRNMSVWHKYINIIAPFYRLVCVNFFIKIN